MKRQPEPAPVFLGIAKALIIQHRTSLMTPALFLFNQQKSKRI
jgi:hypothetical protein